MTHLAAHSVGRLLVAVGTENHRQRFSGSFIQGGARRLTAGGIAVNPDFRSHWLWDAGVLTRGSDRDPATARASQSRARRP